MQEVNHIIGTDLLDYSFKVEQAIKEGWTFSDSNEYAPRAWPHMFEAWMVLSPISQVLDTGNDLSNNYEPSESTSVASKETSEGVDTNNENKLTVESSKGVPKQTNRRNAKK